MTNTDVSLREPASDPLAEQLRLMLDVVEADPDAGPHTGPDWERLTLAMRKVARRRRLRRAGKVTGGAVAALALGAGVMSGVVPYPSFAPTVTLPSAAGHSPMYGDPTRGSLAQDSAWLHVFRQRVSHERAEEEDGGEVWKPPAASGVHVLYAGDVGGYRVALVEGDWHWGPIASPQQVWYLAPAGAAAPAMEKGANDEPHAVDTTVLQPAYLPNPPSRDAVVLVVGSRPAKVVVAGVATIDAGAHVTVRQRAVRPQPDGTYSTVLTSPGSYTVRVDGTVQDGVLTLGPDQGPAPAHGNVWHPLRGGPPLGSDMAGDLADFARLSTLQGPGTGKFALLAAADPATSPRPLAGVLTLPSGARVLVGGSIIAHDVSGTDASLVVPAGPLADLAFAWRSTPAEFHDRPGWTAAVGPVGTVTVQWVHEDGSLTSSPAYHAMASTLGHDISRVRFLDAAGRRLATSAVTAPLRNQDGGGALPRRAGVQSGG